MERGLAFMRALPSLEAEMPTLLAAFEDRSKWPQILDALLREALEGSTAPNPEVMRAINGFINYR